MSADVGYWAKRFRQGCQGCALHPAGPVVAWVELADQLTEEERRKVGEAVAADARLRRALTDDPAVQRRENLVERFVADLFRLDAA